MFNPWKSARVKKTAVTPGISAHSKQISKQRKKKILEEGEADDSDEGMESQERAPPPLINKFEKFPEFIEIDLKPQNLINSSLLSAASKNALNSVLDQKTRELIFLKSFPLTLRVYLVPELNVLTITKSCKTETTID